MTESLFLMQRYWASDDSDIEKEENPGKLEKLLKQAKKRRKLHDSKTTIQINGMVEDEDVHADSSLESEIKHKHKEENVQISGTWNAANLDETLQVSETNKKKKRKCKLSSDGKDVRKTKKVKFENEIILQDEDIADNQPEISNDNNFKIKLKGKKLKNTQNDQADGISQDSIAISDEFEEQGSSCDGFEQQESDNIIDEPAFPIIRDMINKEHAEVKRILPEWLAKPTVIPIDMRSQEKDISELDFLDENTKQNLQACGIQHLFPVQTTVIPWLLGSHLKRLIVSPSDLCVSAPTGSGKTLAFVIPIIQALKIRVVSAIRALVVLPVGNLAVQVYKVFETFCKGTDLQVVLVGGQKPFLQERSSLVRQTTRGYLSRADIIVCTPGRLVDHIDGTPGFNLQKLQYLVVDEADRMMDIIQKGFLKKVENAVYKKKDTSACPCFSKEFACHRSPPCSFAVCTFGGISEPPLQKLMFSATLSQDPEKLHELSLYRPKLFTTVVDASNVMSTSVTDSTCLEEFIGKYITPEGLTEYSVLCEAPVKPIITSYIIKKQKFKKVLCFTQSIEHSHRLYLVLSNMPDFTVRELSSNLKAVQRKIVLQQFELGKIDILVCSDMMARGMDIEGVDCVISYDVPAFIKTYIHRIGRTARAGKDGIAFTLLSKHELPTFRKMLKIAGKKSPTKFNVENSELASFEESFKNALNLSSKIIADEKRNAGMAKRTFLKTKAGKKKSMPNPRNRINNH